MSIRRRLVASISVVNSKAIVPPSLSSFGRGKTSSASGGRFSVCRMRTWPVPTRRSRSWLGSFGPSGVESKIARPAFWPLLVIVARGQGRGS